MEKTRVLIIDNDEKYKETLRAVLKNFFNSHCAVATASGTEEGLLKIANQGFFNLIFLDGNGTPEKAVKDIKLLSSKSKLLFAFPSNPIERPFGASAVFSRSCTTDEIKRMVRRVMTMT